MTRTSLHGKCLPTQRFVGVSGRVSHLLGFWFRPQRRWRVHVVAAWSPLLGTVGGPAGLNGFLGGDSALSWGEFCGAGQAAAAAHLGWRECHV